MSKTYMNALTVDVEDAINLAMRNFFNEDMSPTKRVYDNTLRLLDLFSEYKKSATFFILGEVAEKFPLLIKEIYHRNHELGIHGYSHTTYDNLTKRKLTEEIIKAKKIIEDISGEEVIGHRAPAFSISRKSTWIFDVLYEAGIKYDSSIFPTKINRYGWKGFGNDIQKINTKNGGELIEFPLSTINFLGKEIPVCGGGYLRIFPYNFTDYAFRNIEKRRPVNVYLHPYEIDIPPFSDFYMDAIRKSPLKTKFQIKSYWFNRKTVHSKLSKLLKSYNFYPIREIIHSTRKTEQVKIKTCHI